MATWHPGWSWAASWWRLARQSLPEGVLYDAICETSACLPDAIQLLTPCTVGNGWLRIINLGRYALSLYDKYQGSGVRVFLDARRSKLGRKSKTWLYKPKPKKEQDKERLLEEIKEAGTRDSQHPCRSSPFAIPWQTQPRPNIGVSAVRGTLPGSRWRHLPCLSGGTAL